MGGGILREPLLHLLVWKVVLDGFQLMVLYPAAVFLVVVGLSVALLVGLLQPGLLLLQVDLRHQEVVLALLADLVLPLLAEPVGLMFLNESK